MSNIPQIPIPFIIITPEPFPPLRSIPVNVLTQRHPNGPWIVRKHDALIYSGCQVRIWVDGDPGAFQAALGSCVHRDRERIVFQVSHCGIRQVPRYLLFKNPLSTTLHLPLAIRSSTN
jgi:hypothetical protein